MVLKPSILRVKIWATLAIRQTDRWTCMHRHWSTYTSYWNMTEIDFQSALLMIHGLMSKVWSISIWDLLLDTHSCPHDPLYCLYIFGASNQYIPWKTGWNSTTFPFYSRLCTFACCISSGIFASKPLRLLHWRTSSSQEELSQRSIVDDRSAPLKNWMNHPRYGK